MSRWTIEGFGTWWPTKHSCLGLLEADAQEALLTASSSSHPVEPEAELAASFPRPRCLAALPGGGGAPWLASL